MLMHQRNLQCLRVIYLPLFMTQGAYLCYLSGIRPWSKSSISLSFVRFVWVLPLSILRIVLSILQGGLRTFLYIWSDFCCGAWFREVFFFFWGTVLFFLSSLFVWWCSLPILPCISSSPSNHYYYYHYYYYYLQHLQLMDKLIQNRLSCFYKYFKQQALHTRCC